jgi:hypothetical protein
MPGKRELVSPFSQLRDFAQSVSERSLRRTCPGWKPVRVKKTRQSNDREPRFDSIETEKVLDAGSNGSQQECRQMRVIGRF